VHLTELSSRSMSRIVSSTREHDIATDPRGAQTKE